MNCLQQCKLINEFDAIHYKLNIKHHKTSVIKTYPIPVGNRGAVDKSIQEMLLAEIVEWSDSPYCHPLRRIVE